MNRKMTPAEKLAHGERMRAAWRDGKMAHRRKAQRPDRWMPPEDAMLRDLLGTCTMAEIAERISATYGIPRTPNAVVLRAKRQKLSIALDAFNARGLGMTFNVHGKTIVNWAERGWLAGSQQIPGMQGSQWYFTAAQVERFIRDYPHVYDWQRMRPGRWRALAEIVWKTDPLLTIEQAARAIGVNRSTLVDHCERGWLPSLRRFEKTGAARGRHLIRRSDLKLFRYRRPELVKVSGSKRRAA